MPLHMLVIWIALALEGAAQLLFVRNRVWSSPNGITRQQWDTQECDCHDIARGIVTSSQIERNSPITANADVWDFNHLVCCSIAEIRLIALNVTTPF
jgi:hypothetical protein